MKHIKKLIAGNWKMNGTLSEAEALAKALGQPLASVDMCICPPFPHLVTVAKAKDSAIFLGSQDCSSRDNGAFTGDVSASMLKDIGCQYVILGHSERRQYQGETDKLVAEKAQKAHAQGIITIICVGETEAERIAGQQNQVVSDQLKGSIPPSATAENLVIAYEPVWAIGTGKIPTLDEIRDIHQLIRNQLQEKLDNSDSIRILYGGSVKPENAHDIFAVPHVNGALVGGASLKPEQFLAIAKAA